MNQSRDIEFIYMADPMCSWCWGFSPVIGRVVEELVGDSVFRLIMGGYMAGNSTAMDAEQREYFLGHWRAVHERTEQPFDFAFDMGPEFVYDTGPACRAVVAMQMLDGGGGLPGLSAVQGAF